VIWTTQTGHSYSTTPGGSIFFPMMAKSTGELAIPAATNATSKNRGLMMPRRRRTREQDHRYRVTAERRVNEARIAEEHRKREQWLAATYAPPPF
jgi:hypothetical protein